MLMCSTLQKKIDEYKQSNRTLTAKFKPVKKDNYINAQVIRFNASSMTIRVTSDYPITSPIHLRFAARGEYVITIDYPDGSQRDETYDFEGVAASTTLAAGKSTWEVNYGFGINARDVTLLNWYIDFTEFSDSNFDYIKGHTSDMEYN